jgi:hypothetical protein
MKSGDIPPAAVAAVPEETDDSRYVSLVVER